LGLETNLKECRQLKSAYVSPNDVAPQYGQTSANKFIPVLSFQLDVAVFMLLLSKTVNLKLKTQPKQLLGYLLLDPLEIEFKIFNFPQLNLNTYLSITCIP